MKRTHLIPLLLLFPVFPGCLDVDFGTRIHEDGSLENDVTVTGDSSDIHSGNYTIALDSGWRKSIEKQSDGKFRILVQRTFRDDAEMNMALRGTPGQTLDVSCRLDRKFRWFYETYRFTETWRTFRQFQEIPLERAVTRSELDLLTRHLLDKAPFERAEDSITAERAGKRFEEWEARNVFEGYYKTLLEAVKKAGSPDLTTAIVVAAKDSLASALTPLLEKNGMEKAEEVLATMFGAESVRRVLMADSAGFQLFERKREFQGKVMANSYTVRMNVPGILTSTNSSSVTGSTVVWKDVTNHCFVTDYTMWVESRVIHWWAIFITATVVLGALVFVVIGSIRSRSMP